MRGAPRRAFARGSTCLRLFATAGVLVCSLAPAAADDPGVSGELEIPQASASSVDACPLRVGRLRAETWIAHENGEIFLRIVPEKGILGRCLELGALTLEGPDGRRIEGKRPGDGWDLPIRVSRASTVPAKVDVASERNLGVAVGLRFRLGGGDAAGPEEYRYLVGPLGEEGLAGFVWRGTARDTCAETDIPLALPVDRLVPCSDDPSSP